MAVVQILTVADWKAALLGSNTPVSYILGNNLTFNNLNDLSMLNAPALNLYPNQYFDGNGMTITIDAPPDGAMGFSGLFAVQPGDEQEDYPVCIKNLRVVISQKTQLGDASNIFYAGVILNASASFTGEGPRCVLTMSDIVIESSGIVYGGFGWFMGNLTGYATLIAQNLFLLINEDTSEPEDTGPVATTSFFGTPPTTMSNCAVVSKYNFRKMCPTITLPDAEAIVANPVWSTLYIDLRYQTMMDGMDPPPPLIYNILYDGTATLTDMWVWWGDSSSVASGIAFIHTLGTYDPTFGDPVPGYMELRNVQTNVEYAAIDTSVPGDSVILIDSTLGQTVWSPFPNIGPGFNYDLSPPSLIVFTEPPFAPIVPPNDQTPPVFAIPTVSIQFVPGSHAIVRASLVVAKLYNLTTRPLRYWVQNNENSISTIVSGLNDWVRTPDLFVASADLSYPQADPGPVAKLQVGLSTFHFPRTPQFRMLSTLLGKNAVLDLQTN